MKLIPVAGSSPVTVLDATDEQFETFIKRVGIPVKANNDEGQRWSFDNRCRAINYALKYRLHLPFVEDTGVYAPFGPLSKASQDAFSERARQQREDEHPLESTIAPVVAGQRQYPDLEEGE